DPMKVQRELHARAGLGVDGCDKTVRRATHVRIYGIRVKRKIAENQKYFAFTEVRAGLYRLHPVPTRGALAIVTNAGRGAVDAEAATDERNQSVRQRRVVLTPHGWRRRWQQYMAHRGERVISRKATAQGMSDVLRCPCMLMRTLFRVDRA